MSFVLHEMLQNDSILFAESNLNLLLLMNDSNYPWFVLVPKIDGIKEIHELTESNQIQLLKESSFLSKELQDFFRGDKMNVAALGNMCPQLHIHHIVRFKKDIAWPKPIWGLYTATPYQQNEIDSLKGKLNERLSTHFKF